jgi:hypothetical protein
MIEYSQNYATIKYTDNIPQQLITNILKKKKKPKKQNTSKYDKTTRSLSIVQRIHKAYLACICFNKNRTEIKINLKQF